MAEKKRISASISLMALAAFGSCKIKTICTVKGETFLLYTTRVSRLSPSTAQLTIQGHLRNHLGTNKSLFVDWIWTAGSQEGFWALTIANQRKETPFSVPLHSLYLLHPAQSWWLGLAGSTCWGWTGRAGLFHGWLLQGQLARWQECTCIRNILSATVSA